MTASENVALTFLSSIPLNYRIIKWNESWKKHCESLSTFVNGIAKTLVGSKEQLDPKEAEMAVWFLKTAHTRKEQLEEELKNLNLLPFYIPTHTIISDKN